MDINFIEQHADKWEWLTLSSNHSLPWSESLIERFEDKWDWFFLSLNGAVKKIFNSWTKQEISTALERIKSVHGKL